MNKNLIIALLAFLVLTKQANAFSTIDQITDRLDTIITKLDWIIKKK